MPPSPEIKLKPEILDSFFWRREQMIVALAAKQWELNRKGILFYPFVLEANEDQDKKNELPEFIQAFNHWYPTFDQSLRLSLAILNNGHWTAVDITLAPKKPPVIFCLDAADDGRAESVVEQLAHGIPTARLHYLEQAPVKDLSGREVFRKRQTNNFGCSRNTPIDLCRLAKINVAALLLKIKPSGNTATSTENTWEDPTASKQPKPKNLQKFTLEQLPKEFAAFYKTADNLKSIELLPKHLQDQPVAKNQQSLLEYCRIYASALRTTEYSYTGSLARQQEKIKLSAKKLTEIIVDNFNVFSFFKLDNQGREAYQKLQAQQLDPQAARKYQTKQISRISTELKTTPWYQLSHQVHLRAKLHTANLSLKSASTPPKPRPQSNSLAGFCK
jgi:hypothetical protein